MHLKFDINGQLSTRLYDKRDGFNFVIKNSLTLIVIYQPLMLMAFIIQPLLVNDGHMLVTDA
jgi:hypothetical protein